ncbi:MAG TPA: PTS sugar transporter subunit IIA [Thermoanaerobaculia bacterium]|nr:PTS sugar transporter subunit IIA [Thermoanaerobaculia bacterium]
MRLGSLTRPELIFPDLPAADRPEVLRAFADRVAQRGLVRDAAELYQKLWEREQLGSTGVGSGIAIPHCKIKGLERGVVAVGIVSAGVDFEAVDGQPVKVFFLVVSPSESPAEHLQVLAAISRWVKSDRHAEKILALRDPQEIYDFLRREER